MITSIPASPSRLRSAALGGGIGAAVLVRAGMGSPQIAESIPAAITFGAVLTTMAVAAGWRPRMPRVRPVVAGIAGGAVLVVVPAVVRGIPLLARAGGPPQRLIGWAIVLIVVVVGEEAALRGVLFTALTAEYGVFAAVAVSSLAFALIHVPLYGWGVLPLDIAAGVWLAGLRMATGGISAPVACHLIGDLATGFLP